MLKPYVVVVCEKVIIAKDEVASLIGLFNKIIMAVPKGTEIPKNAVAPYQWAIFSSWDAESGDELNEYMICMQVLYPDGDQFGEITKAKLNIQANRRSQFNSQVIGFPVGQLGKYTVRVWIESDNKAAVQPVEIKIEVAKQEDEKPM
jgi:hypothetical protein